MENPIKMDDLGVPLFLETPIWITAWWLNNPLEKKYESKMGIFPRDEWK